MNHLLLDHQKKCLDFFAAKRVGAIFLPMGLGKTLCALAILWYKGVNKTLILTENTIKRTLEKEINKWGFKAGLKWTTHVITAKNKHKPIPDVDFIIVNYDIIWVLREKLIKLGANCIIADESSDIKNNKARRTIAAIDIANGTLMPKIGYRGKPPVIGHAIPYRFLLTGTSVTKGFEDWFMQFKFLDPKIMPPYVTAFRAMYCPHEQKTIRGGARKGQPYWVMSEYRNIIESQDPGIKPLMERVRPYVFSATKEDCLDLPEKTCTEEFMEMDAEQKAMYSKMKRDAIIEIQELMKEHGAEFKIKASTIMARISKLHQIANGFVINEAGIISKVGKKNPKLEWIKEKIPNLIDSGHKVILWGQYRATALMLKELADEMGWEYGFLHADQTDIERQHQIDMFQSDEATKIFICPIQIGSHGITLTAADYSVFVNKSYNFADIKQAEDRIHRIGQTKNCHYISLVAENTIEEEIQKNLDMKRNILDLTLKELKFAVEGGE